jgi:hypothetical protein
MDCLVLILKRRPMVIDCFPEASVRLFPISYLPHYAVSSIRDNSFSFSLLIELLIGFKVQGLSQIAANLRADGSNQAPSFSAIRIAPSLQ